MGTSALKSYEFRREREASWRRLERLVSFVERGSLDALSDRERIELPMLYRSTLSSLSVARSISLDRAKFRRAVRPGDQLILEAEAIRVRSTTGYVKGRARVGGDLVAEAEIKFILTDAESR